MSLHTSDNPVGLITRGRENVFMCVCQQSNKQNWRYIRTVPSKNNTKKPNNKKEQQEKI